MKPRILAEPPLKKPRFIDNGEENREYNSKAGETNTTNTTVNLIPRINSLFSETTVAVSLGQPPELSTQPSVSPPCALPTDAKATAVEHDQDLLPNDVNHSASLKMNATSLAFDNTTFSSIVGQEVDADTLRVIRECSNNDIERAVNIYFDGTYKRKLNTSSDNGMSIRQRQQALPVKTSNPGQTSIELASQTPLPRDFSSMPEKRYIGAFGVEGWATRSGSKLLKHGDIVKIERQQIELPVIAGTKKKASKLGAAVLVRANSVAARRVDVIVRFTNTSGAEIGRLSKDTANWVSTLIDQNICRFEGTCVYAPERLRTNDTVFLQLRGYLLRSAFDQKLVIPSDRHSTGHFEDKETFEERTLRLRQVALVRLFQEINLTPTRINTASARRAHQGLLKAADLSEKKDKEEPRAPAKVPVKDSFSGQTIQSDEPEDGQELEQDQLDALYRKAQSFDFNTPEAEPPDTFALTLRPYQKQALHWMLLKEKNERCEASESMHPLWEEYSWPLKDVDDKDLPRIAGQPNFYVNPYSGDLSLDFPFQDQHCLGGILADEMGLGKTIQMLSLIHSHRCSVSLKTLQQKELQSKQRINPLSLGGLSRIRHTMSHITHAPHTTLVVTPMSLLAQWQSEAENASSEGSLRSIVYYGTEKSTNLQTLYSHDQDAIAPDIIITSYGVILSEFTQMLAKRSANEIHTGKNLFSINFFRVILDEAHMIKNRQSKTAKACYALLAEHRWALTGTPVVNRLEDLFSLIKFLRVEPWNNFSFWRTFVTVPFESKDFMQALDVVQTVLEPLVMRRTKDMKTPGGHPLVLLPAKQINVVEVDLSKAERAVYDHIYMRVKRSFTANVEAGTVMKSFTSIFAQVLRLRQCCCHPVLVRNMDIVADEVVASEAADAAAGLADDMDLQALVERFTATTDDSTDVNAFGAHVLGQIRDEATNECPICSEEPMINQTVTGCWHSACKLCLIKFIEYETNNHRLPRCFHCREIINRHDLFEIVRHDDDPDTADELPRISLQRIDVNESSAKIVCLIQSLRELRRERPTIKSVVFSQFTSFLSLIEPALRRYNIKYLRLDGTMQQKARTAVLDEFRQTDRFTVLLLSLRAGGVGLNLTMAKRVYLMDPWWSFSVEAQAIDRVHRMGQDEEVKVYRFIVKGSVEEKMLKIQERKNFIATSLGMMTDEEKKLQRIEDIKELLS